MIFVIQTIGDVSGLDIVEALSRAGISHVIISKQNEGAAEQSVHPTKGWLALRACVNGECGWVGKESACLTWKHAGDERMCPHCHDNTEFVSLSALRW